MFLNSNPSFGGDAAMFAMSCHQIVVQLYVQLCRRDLLLRYRLPDYNTASLPRVGGGVFLGGFTQHIHKKHYEFEGMRG